MKTRPPIVFSQGNWFAYAAPRIVNGHIRFAPVRHYRPRPGEVVEAMWFTEILEGEEHFGPAYCVQNQGGASSGVQEFLTAAEAHWGEHLTRLRDELARA
jgi:hypothetical protein